jgi:hypothetical protein
MSNKDDSTASLGDSEVLSVQNPVADAIADFCQGSEECSEVSSLIDAKSTWDIFPDEPFWLQFVNQPDKGKGEVTTWVIQSLSESSDRECLAWGSSNNKVNCTSLDVPVFVFI